MDARIQEVLDSINRDLSRSQSVAEMAESVNLSPSRFSRLFKIATNQSPGRYVRTIRIEKAKKMLESTLREVKDICSMVGIGDASHFVRAFRRLYGLSPGEYRKERCGKGRRPGKKHRGSK